MKRDATEAPTERVKRDAPATHRNRAPILEVLRRWLKGPARVLEIASGSGQHAVFFAEALPGVDWQPSDPDPEALASIRAWAAEAGVANLRPPLALDVAAPDWAVGLEPVDAIFNANMIHIAPWRVAEGLFAGVPRVLRSGGLLFLYGPFRVGGAHTAPSNAAFDASLRARNPEWGVRELDRVLELADAAGLEHVATEAMPANNLLVVLRRGASASEDAAG